MRARLATLLSLLACLALAPAAIAATPAVTAQAEAAQAAFLAYAPPPAQGPGALCLVDTGVSANPDTAPGLLSATALEGASGADVDPQGHGTTMAMIAGGAGAGMIGAWPQLKIVSIRATSEPSPGQDPTFEFDDYTRGIEACLQEGVKVDAIDLALSSSIPPSPDQAQNFQNAVAEADAANVAIVAAAGDTPGPVQEPAAEPGVLAVGAFTAQPDQLSTGPRGSVCSFSANEGLTFYGPGCGLNQANPFTDTPECCGDGTSQASAFVGAVIVALMSYDPTLTYARAEQLLVSTATDGDLNVTAAFDADGLGEIVSAGNAAIPAPAAPAPPAAPATTATASAPPAAAPVTTTNRPTAVKLRSLSWRRGVLRLKVASVPAGELLHLRLYLAHRTRALTSKHASIKLHIPRPRLIELSLARGATYGPTLKARLKAHKQRRAR